MTKIAPLFLLLTSFSVLGQTTIYSTDFQSGIPNAFTIIDNDLNTPAGQVAEFSEAWIDLLLKRGFDPAQLCTSEFSHNLLFTVVN